MCGVLETGRALWLYRDEKWEVIAAGTRSVTHAVPIIGSSRD